MHGGQIWVESTLEQGSVFTFTLLIDQQVRPSAVQGSATPGLADCAEFLDINRQEDSQQFILITEAAVPELIAGSSEMIAPHILIVDDEPVNLQVLKNFLKFQNYTLTLASDGQAALTLLEQGLEPDIILLDIMTPRMTGYEVVETIRRKVSADRLPIILLSARNQPEDIVLGLEVGANDYLTKPINKDELLARIYTHLQIHQLEAETIRLTIAHERQLVQFLDALPIGVTVHNSDGSIFYFNQMAKQLLQQDELPNVENELPRRKRTGATRLLETNTSNSLGD